MERQYDPNQHTREPGQTQRDLLLDLLGAELQARTVERIIERITEKQWSDMAEAYVQQAIKVIGRMDIYEFRKIIDQQTKEALEHRVFMVRDAITNKFGERLEKEIHGAVNRVFDNAVSQAVEDLKLGLAEKLKYGR